MIIITVKNLFAVLVIFASSYFISSINTIVVEQSQSNNGHFAFNSSSVDIHDLEHNHNLSRTPISTSTLSTNEKPKLILHIGPRKTGSSTIQQRVLTSEQIMKNGVKRGGLLQVLKEDNYVSIPFGYAKYMELIDELENEQAEVDGSLWNELMSEYDDAYSRGENAIHSLEGMSEIPKNEYTQKLYRQLQEKWDVRIVMIYRPFHQWITSLYNEMRKTKLYQIRDGHTNWRDLHHKFNTKTLRMPFPEWLDTLEDDWEDYLMRNGDPLSCKNWWGEIFGMEKVTVIDLMHVEKDDLRIEFACNVLENATNACRRANKHLRVGGTVNHLNHPPDMISDMDMLIMDAYDQGILPREVKQSSAISDVVPSDLKRGHIVNRAASMRVLGKKLLDHNVTVFDLPKKCISKKQESLILNRSIKTEESMAVEPLSEEDILKSLHTSHKFCTVDTEAVFADKEFLKMFASSDYLMENYDDDDFKGMRIVPPCKRKCSGIY